MPNAPEEPLERCSTPDEVCRETERFDSQPQSFPIIHSDCAEHWFGLPPLRPAAPVVATIVNVRRQPHRLT